MGESMQKWLERNRPPRVRITYDVETGGAIEKRELPFVVGLFSDLSGERLDENFPEYASRSMQDIDRDNFNDVLAKAQPSMTLGKVSLKLPSPDGEATTLSGTLTFGSLDDFEPVAVIKAVPLLDALHRTRSHIRMLQAKAESSAGLAKVLEPLMQLDAAGRSARQPYKVLGAPAARDGLGVAAAALRDLAFKLAQASTTDAKTALATGFGFTDDSASKKTALGRARQFLGLYAATDTTDNVSKATDQVEALASYAQDSANVGTTTKKKRDGIVTALNIADADQAALGQSATALLTQLKTPLADDATQEQTLAQGDALLAALLLLDQQEPEDHAAVATVDATSGTRISPQVVAEAQHLADCRWYANNLLIKAKGGAAPAPAPTPKSKPKPAAAADTGDASAAAPADAPAPAPAPAFTPAAPAPAPASTPAAPAPATAATPISDVQTVLDLMDATGLSTDLDRRQFLPSLGDFVTEILAPLDSQSPSTRKWIPAVLAVDQRVAQIDEQISLQLREIMHADMFQQLEATWRGLHYLVSRAETGKMLKLRIFNATQQELLDDMEKAVDKDQSHLFKMIYEAAYGTLGGEPYSLLVGGYEIGRSAQHVEFLMKMAEIAAAAHAPFITAASPSIFGFQAFTDLARPRDLEKIFEGVQLAGFNAFRQSEDSRYVTLVLPHFLLRLPYGAKSWPVEGLGFEEKSEASDHSDFLWGNAAYLLAERITHAYSLYSWTAAIRGVEGGGLIEDLPLYTYPVYPNNPDALQLFCPTEVSITDRREKELSDLGFIALCHCLGTGNAVFFGGQTTNEPKTYISDSANANARLSASLPYILAASRFAHYIKVIMRDKIGSFMTRGNVETFLNSWISQYVLLDENAPQDAKAAYPLSQAHVAVSEVPGSPGTYTAVVFLRPHFQLEELTASIRLVANLPG